MSLVVQVLACEHALAEAWLRRGRLAAALAAHRRVLTARHRRHGPCHPATAASCVALADACRAALVKVRERGAGEREAGDRVEEEGAAPRTPFSHRSPPHQPR